MKTVNFAACALAAASALAGGPASATVLFSDSLQGTLANWTSYFGDVSIAPAPGGGNAATWSSIVNTGDLATNASFTSGTGSFTISFDTYGNCGQVNGCGLFLANGAHATSDWYLADTLNYPGATPFTQTVGGWERVSYTFARPSTVIDFENWDGSPYSQASSFFLRNVVLTDNPDGTAIGTLTITPVPEPSSWALMLLGFGAVGYVLRRRGRTAVRTA